MSDQLHPGGEALPEAVTVELKQGDQAYLDTWLWLPKNLFPDTFIAASLSIEYPDGTINQLWSETDDHFVVPRSFMSREELTRRHIPLVDRRIKKFRRAVTFHDEVELWDHGPHQQSAAYASLLEGRDGLLVLGCGKGKTPISLKLAAHLSVPTLVVVHTEAVMDQWAEEIEVSLGVPREEVGRIYGKRKEWDTDIAIAMIHSTAMRHLDWPPSMLRRWGLVIFDEVHMLGAPVFQQAAPLFPGRRLGLTGTWMRDDSMEPVFLYHCGPILHHDVTQAIRPRTEFHTITTKLDMDDKDVTKEVCNVNGEIHHSKLCRWLGDNEERNHVVLATLMRLLDKGRKILVLNRSKPPLYLMGDMLMAMDVDAVVVTGDQKKDRLETIRGSRVALCTDKVGDTGVNDTALDTIVWLTPPGSGSRDDPEYYGRQIQQSYGRIQREHDGEKRPPLVVVFEDKLIHRMRSQCLKMRKTLRRLGYDYKIVKGKT